LKGALPQPRYAPLSCEANHASGARPSKCVIIIRSPSLSRCVRERGNGLFRIDSSAILVSFVSFPNVSSEPRLQPWPLSWNCDWTYVIFFRYPGHSTRDTVFAACGTILSVYAIILCMRHITRTDKTATKIFTFNCHQNSLNQYMNIYAGRARRVRSVT
jgi:hypothetical protein